MPGLHGAAGLAAVRMVQNPGRVLAGVLRFCLLQRESRTVSVRSPPSMRLPAPSYGVVLALKLLMVRTSESLICMGLAVNRRVFGFLGN